jgi:hypothetical protein
MNPITIAEIEYASKVLFNGDSSKFYDDIENKTGERVNTIQCLESKPIVACPGSGKTTVLLAKLIILARRMPFDDSRGICVLTHTNVAIDLIKEKLGTEASKLFAYPNFFGTIQSFVDKFLTIPYCSCKSNNQHRPIIDNILYFRQIDSYRKYLGKKTNHFCLVNQRKGYPYSICWDDFNIVDENKCNVLKLDLSNADQKEIYLVLRKMKSNINGGGVLSFLDAYYVANKYINALPIIIQSFQERFKFVFIDEMQDTATHQSNIINKLFKGSDITIVQEFGDPNQAIYDYDGQSGEWDYDGKNCMHLSKSKRFGNKIASIINPLRIKSDEPTIEGENAESVLQPHIIIFDESNPDYAQKVLDEFGKLIIENGLHKCDRKKFVAVGRVGKENEKGKITLKTYWTGFEKESVKTNVFYTSLIEYLGKDYSNKKFNYSEKIINGILHLLEIHDFKNESINKDSKKIQRRFTKTTLFDFLKNENEELYFEFRTLITDYGLMIKSGKYNFNIDVHAKIIDFVKDKLLVLKNIPLDEKNDFLIISKDVEAENQKVNKTNIYEYNDEAGNVIPIKLNTIHGEKGETHTATLYLETYKNKSYDSLLIQKQLEGKPFNKSYNYNASKLAYVAMSRPEKLLCFAVSSSRITEQYANEKIKPRGWKVEII